MAANRRKCKHLSLKLPAAGFMLNDEPMCESIPAPVKTPDLFIHVVSFTTGESSPSLQRLWCLALAIREIVRASVAIVAAFFVSGQVQALASPPPLIGQSYANDTDGDGIEDQLFARCAVVAGQVVITPAHSEFFALHQLFDLRGGRADFQGADHPAPKLKHSKISGRNHPPLQSDFLLRLEWAVAVGTAAGTAGRSRWDVGFGGEAKIAQAHLIWPPARTPRAPGLESGFRRQRKWF